MIKKEKLKLTVYKNGFILDNGELRNKNDPQNKKLIPRNKKKKYPK